MMEFKRHFSRQDLEKLFDEGFTLPGEFMFGVANAGFQVEGGYNGPGEPLNNWVTWERSDKVERSGEAVRFWSDHAAHVGMASSIGLNGFRMGIEWARVQPTATTKCCTVPPFDRKAIERYAEILAAVMRAGMEPVVTLHHFTHPYWLGLDMWLDNRKLEFFAAYVEEVTRSVNTLLVEAHGLRPVQYYVTLNEPNGLAPIAHLVGYMPHYKSGYHRTLLAASNMMDAHCRAYDTVHRVYTECGWADPMVTYNTIHFSTYALDKLWTDLLNARRNGVERRDLAGYLAEGRKAWDAEIAKCPVLWRPPWLNRQIERIATRLSERILDPDTLKEGVDAIYASPEPGKLDYLAVDYYDPFISHLLQPPSLKDLKEKRFSLNQELWEQVLNPAALYHFLKAETINGEGLPLFILENGMCYRVKDGVAERRYDGATMDVFLQSYLYEVMRALKDGLPLKGYFWWTLADNYEWGSYEPRFGLHTVDRTTSPVEILDRDAGGVDAARAFGDIIAALRSSDRGRMVEAFLKDDWR
jgi:beta-glucosidase